MKRKMESDDSSEDESRFEEAAVTGQFILSKSSIKEKTKEGKDLPMLWLLILLCAILKITYLNLYDICSGPSLERVPRVLRHS